MIRMVIVLFALIIITASAFAIQVDDLQGSIIEQGESLTSFKAEINARLSQLEQKIDTLPTQDSMTGLLSQHLSVTNGIMDFFRSQLIITIVIMQFLFVGLAVGVLLWLKMEGRI